MSEKVNVTVGPGCGTLLFITFLVLKLTEVIDWSWWWVTAPLWVPVCGFICIALFLMAMFAFAGSTAIDSIDKILKKK
mgnify:CR=1 FL=1|tara:strand:+ start:11525 stop:11758 length:234 start_codon:yes stop_codon:yes gene_type:complete